MAGKHKQHHRQRLSRNNLSTHTDSATQLSTHSSSADIPCTESIDGESINNHNTLHQHINYLNHQLSNQDSRFHELEKQFIIEQQLRIDAENKLNHIQQQHNEQIFDLQTKLQGTSINYDNVLDQFNQQNQNLLSIQTYVSQIELKLGTLLPLPSINAEEMDYFYGHSISSIKSCHDNPNLIIANTDNSNTNININTPTINQRRRFTISAPSPLPLLPPPLRLLHTTTSTSSTTNLPSPTSTCSPGLSPITSTMTDTNSITNHTMNQDNLSTLHIYIHEQNQIITELQSLVRDLERELCKTRISSTVQADLHLEYLKNVLVKFYTPGEEQYRELFFNVMSHILKLTPDEHKVVHAGMNDGNEHTRNKSLLSSSPIDQKRGSWFGIF